MKRSPLTLADILDMEFFFKRDESRLEQGDDSQLRHRDRAIFQAAGLDETKAPGTRELAHHWLAARRREYRQRQEPLPGQIWQETTSLGAVLLFFCSLLLAGGLAASFLRYDGSTPVNVSGFFAIFIVLQLLLLLVNLALFGYRFVRRINSPKSVLYRLLTTTLTRLFEALCKRSQKHLPAARRLDLQAATGSLRQLRQVYGNLLLWPAFILLQLAGSSFNLGVLLSLLAKVSFTDIAFGWQSTLPVSDTFLAQLVRLIALPWSWFAAQGWAYPNLEQIIGSKIVLIEGNWRLTSLGLTSWWPFLLCGILVYGLLPRLLLLAWGCCRLRAGLNDLSCDSAAFRQLRRRMLTPLVQTEAPQQIPLMAARQPDAPTPDELPKKLTGTGYLLVIPDELWDNCPPDLVTSHLTELDGSGPLIPIRHGAIDETAADFLARASDTLKNQKLAGIVVIQEAWQPPIRELTTLLQQLRRIIGGSSPLLLALTGKPTAAVTLTPVHPPDLSLWLKTTKALGDPHLDVFSLVRN